MEILVPTIACQGCVDTLISAITKLDATAVVSGDPVSKKLQVTSTLSLNDIKQVIANAGHTPA
jgi:hypothetical protein